MEQQPDMDDRPPTAIIPIQESQTVALATSAEAEVKARYLIARSTPRDMAAASARLLGDCARLRFAEGARYKRPAGKRRDDSGAWVEQYAEGFSIRFAEAALRAMGNIFVASSIIYEDDRKIRLRTVATDLEANATIADETEVEKTVERKSPRKGQRVLGERTNTYGDRVYIVEASADELAMKVGAVTSKRLRTLVLRLVPADLLEEAGDAIKRTIAEAARRDPAGALDRLLRAFAGLKVGEADLDEYLTSTRKAPAKIREGITDEERDDLVAIGAGIKDGASTWAAVMAEVRGDVAGDGASEVERLRARVAERLKATNGPAPAPAPASAPAPGEQIAPPPQRDPNTGEIVPPPTPDEPPTKAARRK